MITEYYLDLEDDTGQIGITGLRCTSCGDVIDPVILRNRLNPMPDLLQGPKQRKYAQQVDQSTLKGQDGNWPWEQMTRSQAIGHLSVPRGSPARELRACRLS